jgi:hypothetical protein
VGVVAMDGGGGDGDDDDDGGVEWRSEVVMVGWR